jgi:hypothetical protein
LAAPDSTYRKIRDDLSSIRDDFRETYPIIDSLHFHPWWGIDLEVSFDAPGRWEIRQGSHQEWNELNSAFGVTEVDTLPWTYGFTQVILSFRKRLHPAHIQDAYLGLRGVSWVGYQPGAAPPPGVIPRRIDTTRAYLFRLRSDDGLNNEYWYFRMTDEEADYVGYYDGEAEEPDWWPEATGQ